MKTEIIKQKKTKTYEYVSLLIADKKLTDYELVKKWNYGVDCKKEGNVITVLLQKAL